MIGSNGCFSTLCQLRMCLSAEDAKSVSWWVYIHCALTPTESHCPPLSTTDPPQSPKDSRWAPPTPTGPQWTSNDLYWAPLTPTKSFWAQCSLHLAPLSYIHPSVTHNDPFLSQMNPIWPQITLNNFRLSPNCLKRPQLNQLCQLSSTSASFPS